MSRLHYKIWFLVSFSLAVVAVVIRSIWEIVLVPTPNILLMFISLIVALVGGDVFLWYLVLFPRKLRSLPVCTGVTLVLTAGLVAGVKHYINYIPSPEAQWLLSKIIATLIVVSSVSVYVLLLWMLWTFRKKGRI